MSKATSWFTTASHRIRFDLAARRSAYLWSRAHKMKTEEPHVILDRLIDSFVNDRDYNKE